MKNLQQGKMNMTTIILAVIGVILVVVVIIAISRSGKDGQNSRAGNENTETQSSQLAVTEDAFYESGEGYNVILKHPTFNVSSIDSDTEKFVMEQAKAFSSKADASSEVVPELNAEYKVFQTNDFVNVVYTLNENVGGVSTARYAARTYMGGEMVALDGLLEGPFLEPVSKYLKSQLNKRFPDAPVGSIDALTGASIGNFQNFRVADNGMVFMFPTSQLRDGAVGNHEVLVPLDVIEPFKKY